MAKKQEEAPVTEMAAETQSEPTFLKDVAQLATLAEGAIRKLRTERHGGGFKFEDMDLSHLFIGSQDSPDSEYLKYRLKPAVLTYLRSTAPLGLNERADSRTGTPIEENTPLHDFTVTAWMSSVYTTRKEEIDKRVEEGIRHISRSATAALRDIIFDVCSGSSEIDRALAVAGRPALTLEELAGKMCDLKTALYRTELPHPEDLARLYELCFNSEVEKRGWLELEDAPLVEVLKKENAQELFRKYNPERDIKVPEEKNGRTGIKVIDRILELTGGNPAAGRSRAEAFGNQRNSQILILDPASAENNTNKNQDQWIVYWNNITDGRRFASMADYYQVFKQLTDALQNGSPAERNQANQLIASLREDLQESWLITSTRIIYQPNSLEARLIHGYGANNPQLTSVRVLPVPSYYKGTPIASVYAASEGLTYLQALFNTEDSGQTIAERLSTISGYQPQNIKLWTPPLRSNQWLTRRQLAGRAVGLGSNGRRFRLCADWHPTGDFARSRGVR